MAIDIKRKGHNILPSPRCVVEELTAHVVKVTLTSFFKTTVTYIRVSCITSIVINRAYLTTLEILYFKEDKLIFVHKVNRELNLERLEVM